MLIPNTEHTDFSNNNFMPVWRSLIKLWSGYLLYIRWIQLLEQLSHHLFVLSATPIWALTTASIISSERTFGLFDTTLIVRFDQIFLLEHQLVDEVWHNLWLLMLNHEHTTPVPCLYHLFNHYVFKGLYLSWWIQTAQAWNGKKRTLVDVKCFTLNLATARKIWRVHSMYFLLWFLWSCNMGRR